MNQIGAFLKSSLHLDTGVPAPIVLQNIAVILAGVILGPWRGAASMALFAGLVALGLPLLSGGRGERVGVVVGDAVELLRDLLVGGDEIGRHLRWDLTRGVRHVDDDGAVVTPLVDGEVHSPAGYSARGLPA